MVTIQVTSRRKWSQWNYNTKPIVDLPLVEWGSAAGPKLFGFCHAFAASSSIFLLIKILQDSEATFGTKFMSKNLKKHLYLTLSQGNYQNKQPLPHGRVLQCPSFLQYLCMFLQLIAFVQLIYFFAIVFCTFWCQYKLALYAQGL